MSGTRSFDTVRQDTLAVFDQISELAAGSGAAEVADGLKAAHVRLLDGRLVVIVCGEFKRGKSTLLNALLDEPGLFPADTILATSVVSTISYGAAERVDVLLGDDTEGTERLETRQISRADIVRYVTESANPHNALRAQLLRIEAPNAKLASGLSFVDTPGVGGMHAAHTAATMMHLPHADAILFVLDVKAPMTDSERAFLQTAIEAVKMGGDLDALACVLTKIDLDQDYPVLVGNTRDKLATMTGRPAENVNCIPVSSTAKLAYLATGDSEDLEASNFPALEEFLWTALSRRRARVLLGDALIAQGSAVTALLHPIEVALEAAAAATEADREKIRQQQEEARTRLADLEDGQAEWRSELAAQFDSLRRDLIRYGRDQMTRVWSGVDQMLEQQSFLDDPERLANQLNADAATVAGALQERAERKAASILRQFAASHNLVLAPPETGRLPEPPVPALVPVQVPDVTDEAIRAGRRDALLRMNSAEKVGGLVGIGIGIGLGVLFPPAGMAALAAGLAGGGMGGGLGAVIGRLFGANKGAEEARLFREASQRKATQKAIKDWARPIHDSHLTALLDAITDAASDLSRRTSAELVRRIRQEKAAVEAALARLREAERDTVAKSQARAAELRQERAPLDTLQVRIGRLTAEADALGARQGADGRPTQDAAAPGTDGQEQKQPVPEAAAESWADE